MKRIGVAILTAALTGCAGIGSEYDTPAKPNQIPRKHRNKKLLRQNADGEYEIHDAILQMARDLKLQP